MAADPEVAKGFYTGVLGWQFTEPDEQFGGYVMALVDGAPVAGLGPVMPGARLGWTMYFAGDDADATAAAVREAGGTVFADPVAVGDLGRMFVAADPTGAVFGVWQAGTFIGSPVSSEPGALIWEDLRSTDPAAAMDFYHRLFGFEYAAVDMASDEYRTFAVPGDDRPRGGIGGMMGADGVPSHWLVTYAVADLDAALAAVDRLGGAVPIPAFDSPYGRMAAITDAEGSGCWLMQPV